VRELRRLFGCGDAIDASVHHVAIIVGRPHPLESRLVARIEADVAAMRARADYSGLP
jgi:hypothetical protein